MRKFSILGLGLQGTPHDLRACPNHRLLQLLADDLLWYVLYVYPVAFDYPVHLLAHLLQELLALLIDHPTREQQLAFLRAHDRAEHTALPIVFLPLIESFIGYVVLADCRLCLLSWHRLQR